MIMRGRPLILISALAVAALGVYLLPVADTLGAALEWIDANRTMAWAVYIVGYIAATVLLVPGSIITVAAGFIFGLPLGIAVVSAGSVLGSTAAFLLGRSFVRDWVEQKIAGMPRFEALDRATRHSGFAVVMLTRLSPLFPFNLLNYAFGLTSVSLRSYFFASWIGMLPGTVLYVYIGTLTNDLTFIVAGDFEAGRAGTVLLVGGLIATAILTVMLTRRATRILRERLEMPDGGPDERDERTGS
jgi:uncharacterized membrane protein YdjX (TVP38/TMEM64 family)